MRAGILDDVGGDNRIRCDTEDTAIPLGPGILGKHLVHLVHRRRFCHEGDDVRERSNGDGRSDGHAIESATIFG